MSDKLFFHVTTKRRINSIMQQGIEPTGRHRRWKNAVGGTLGNRGYIYLMSDFTAAVKWAAKMDYDLNPQRTDGKRSQHVVILCLRNVPEDQLEPDPNVEGQMQSPGKWFQMKGTIGPENIVKVIPLTDEMVKQAVYIANHGGTIPIA
jgi:hypothetical protein